MATLSRGEALAVLEEGDLRVRQLLRGLSDAQLSQPATIGGGDWSAKDLIAHLASWEELALERLEAVAAGELVPPFPPGGVDGFNAEQVPRSRSRSVHEVRADARSIHTRLVDAIGATSDEQWRVTLDVPGGRARLGTSIGGLLGAPRRPFGHAFAHIPDLEEYVTSIS